MPEKSPSPRFERRPLKGMPGRVASYCKACQDFIAASDKPKALKIAEKAHQCPQQKLR
jgi:hypothetical protein